MNATSKLELDELREAARWSDNPADHRALALAEEKNLLLAGRMSWAGMTKASYPPLDFVIGGLQPGDIGILSGADGCGKSWLALSMAATVATGISVGGVFDSPRATGKTLIIAGEDRHADHGRRAKKIGQWLTTKGVDEDEVAVEIQALAGLRFPLMAAGRGGEAMEKTGMKALADATKGYRLVIIDPLRMFHGLNESDGPGMDALARSLVRIAMENQQAIVCVHHASQSAILDGRSDHHVGRGATDFPAACRAAWTVRGMGKEDAKKYGFDLDADRSGWRLLANGKSSHAPESADRWLRRGDGGMLIACGDPVPEATGKAAARAYRGAKSGFSGVRDDDDF